MTLYESIQLESLSNIITKFSRKSSCSELDQFDVQNFTLIFGYCANIYKKLAAYHLIPMPTAEQAEELRLIPICRDRALIDSYKYLIDKEFYFRENTEFTDLNLEQIFLNNDKTAVPVFQDQAVVRYTSIYFSINKSDTKFLIPFYTSYLEPNFLNKPLENQNYEIVGVNFDIKIDLFNSIIQSSYDYLFITLSILFILSLLYVKSLLLTTALLVSIVFALFESYIAQKLIFLDENFSYLNICSIFLLILTSCQNVFVLVDVWREAKLKYKNVLLIDNQLEIIDTSHPSTSMHLKNKIKSVYSGNRKDFDLINTNSPNNHHQESGEDRDDLYVQNCVLYLFKNAGVPLLISCLCKIACLLVNLNSSIISVKYFSIYSSLLCLAYFIISTIIIPCCLVINLKYLHRIK